MKELPKKNDAAEMVGVVGGKADELVAHGHDAGGCSGAGWTTDGLVEAGALLRGCRCQLSTMEEALTKLFPRFGVGF